MAPVIISLCSIAMIFLWIVRTVCATIKKLLEVIIEDTVKVLKWIGIIILVSVLLRALILLTVDPYLLWEFIKEGLANFLETVGGILFALLLFAAVLLLFNLVTGGILAGLASLIFNAIVYVLVGVLALLFSIFEGIDDISTKGFYKLLESVDKRISDKGGEKP